MLVYSIWELSDMAKTIQFCAPSGMTLTAKLFAIGSDTVVETISTITEATNRKGTYTGTVTSTGTYEFLILNGSTPINESDVVVVGSDDPATYIVRPSAAWDIATTINPTSTLDLSGTTISASQTVASVSGAVGSVTGNVGGNVTGSIGSLSTQAKADVNAEADTALADAGLTLARMGYVDNLNIGGNVASSAEVTSIQNNTRVVRVVPDMIERPDSGTTTYRIELMLYDSVGNMEAPDSAPTVALVNESGTDRSSRLDSTTMSLVSTGRYRSVYTSDASDAVEQLVWTFSVVEGGATRVYGNSSLIVDTTAVDFTSADRTKLESVYNKLPSKSFLTGTTNSDGDVQMDEATGNFAGSVGSVVSTVTTGAFSSLLDLTDTMKSSVNAEADAALADVGLTTTITGRIDTATSTRLASASYTAPDNATIATISTNVDTLLARITSSLFSGITSLGKWLGILAGSTADSGTLAEIQATTGGTSFDNATDSLQAQRDNIGTNGASLSLAKGTQVTGFNDLSSAQVNAEADAALSDVGLTTTITGRINATIDSRMATFTLPSNFSLLSIDLNGAVTFANTIRLKKNTAFNGFTFPMFDSTDRNPITGLTVSATRSSDGAAFAACTNSPAEISDGVYKIDLSADDLNANDIMLKLSASGAVTMFIKILTQP